MAANRVFQFYMRLSTILWPNWLYSIVNYIATFLNFPSRQSAKQKQRERERERERAMESKASSRLGSSLPVPCVQELAKEPLAAVPPRYRRRDQDPTAVSSSTCSCPILDMEKLLSGDRSELEKLDSACREWGFFQVIENTFRKFLNYF